MAKGIGAGMSKFRAWTKSQKLRQGERRGLCQKCGKQRPLAAGVCRACDRVVTQ